MRRSYHQFCAVARALDLLGERWTLLIVRDLLLGPRRYGEMLDALPSMGTNLLAARLEALVTAGVCVKDGPLYALSDRGAGLRDVVLALARWEAAEMRPPRPGDRMRGDWYAVAMLAVHRPPKCPVRAESYEFEVDAARFHLAVGDGPPTAHRGPAPAPAFRLTADVGAFLAVATRRRPPSTVALTGDRRAARRWLDAFALPAPRAAGRAAGDRG